MSHEPFLFYTLLDTVVTWRCCVKWTTFHASIFSMNAVMYSPTRMTTLVDTRFTTHTVDIIKPYWTSSFTEKTCTELGYSTCKKISDFKESRQFVYELHVYTLILRRTIISLYTWIAKHVAYNHCISQVPIVVTDSPPLSIIPYFDTALA